ncbi:P-loop containing nucleoside triphosphate hydrolase protein [Gorgonomyces haynaldii]|nr:P-loop containing nucleoside triphosphate hydrolase protein [Gorgonomyces haynaldii]
MIIAILEDENIVQVLYLCSNLLSTCLLWFICHCSLLKDSNAPRNLWPFYTLGLGLTYFGLDLQDFRYTLNLSIAVIYGLLLVLDLTNPKRNAHITNKTIINGRPVCPESTASLFSKISFSWVNPLMALGQSKTLGPEDFPHLPEEDQMHNITRDWERSKSRQRSVLLNMLWFTRKYPIFQFFATILLTVFNFAKPFFVNRLLTFIQTKADGEYGFGLLLLGGLFLSLVIRQTLEMAVDLSARHWGIQLRAIFVYEIFKKSLRRANSATDAEGKTASQGKIVNLMSADTNQVRSFITDIHTVLIEMPLSVFMSVSALLYLLGTPALAGLAVMLLTMPLTSFVLTRLYKVLRESRLLMDARIQKTNEALHGIKIIKYMAWEPQFIQKISDAREKELQSRLQVLFANILLGVIAWASSILVTFTAFFFYTVVAGYQLDAATAFTSISLLSTVSHYLTQAGEMISDFMNVQVTLGRINDFLSEEELVKYLLPKRDITMIGFQNADFTYHSSKETRDDETAPLIQDHVFSLQDLNIEFPIGKLTVIIGPTGSGKSSLLGALLGEMKALKGDYYLPEEHLQLIEGRKSDVAYVPQTAWLMNDTIRENILFGEPFDQERYNQVIIGCALKRDLETLGGDLTEIGEKGVTLSGGQKQRVSLARAAYSRAPIVLLDDPLSAVDAPTGRHLLNHCILTLFKGRTVLLVTHAVSLVVPQADFCVVMENGRVQASGTPNEITKEELYKETFEPHEETFDMSVMGKNLVEKEARAEGAVKFATYKVYLMACGGFLFMATVVLMFCVQVGTDYAGNWWIQVWTDNVHHQLSLLRHKTDWLFMEAKNDSNPLYYIVVYGLIGVFELLVRIFRQLLQYYGGLSASRKMHHALLKSVMGSPLRFFETTPIGRLINRFSKDIRDVDTSVLFTTMSFIMLIFGTIVRIFLVALVTPPFLGAVVISYFYYAVGKYYLKCSREIKRVESVSASPIYARFGESLTGVSSIRAYGAEYQMIQEMEKKVDANHRAWFYLFATNRWLSFRTGILTGILIFAAGVSVLYSNLSAGWAGVTFSFTITITMLLGALIRMHSSVEMAMNAVERVQEYSQLEQEPPFVIESNRPPTNWPQEGSIRVRNLSMQYAPDLPIVLRNLNFDIRPREKIGIVGRTGAGKSTLSMAFFRILPFATGTIEIDGIDIQKIGLHDLRSRLTIIPQDPVLFEGTLRSNLDPLEEHDDDKIWRAVEQTGLIQSLQTTLKDGKQVQQQINLDAAVAENGSNFSQGQRQLLCLARAILRSSRFIFMDEATASVDAELDQLIQKVIRTQFTNGCVLTVAHRLRTVMDYDRIMLLDQGSILEFDTPKRLLDGKGPFYSMCMETGEYSELYRLAKS